MLQALATALTMIAVVPAPGRVAHICWIDRVEVEGSGVRIFFVKGAPVPRAEAGIHAEPGAVLSPATSGHDGCTITVSRKGRQAGVDAEAHLFLHQVMTGPEISKEWIAAVRPD